MSTTTGIEWTDATWNPIRGCSRVSEGCRNCYAEKVAYRFSGPGQPYEGLVQVRRNANMSSRPGDACTIDVVERLPLWNGQIRFVEEHLLDPLKWRAPKRIFVNSMSDLFHENVTDEMLDRIFAVMALSPQHTFQVLTKRPERMLKYLSDDYLYERWLRAADEPRVKYPKLCGVAISDPRRFPLQNVWLGVSVENQKAADERIPLLLATPAAVRFLSAEPLLGPVDLEFISCRSLDLLPEAENDGFCCLGRGACSPTELKDGSGVMAADAGVDWVICGGESGPGARPMHPDWARGLRDQCAAAGVPFFFKQWGEWTSEQRPGVEVRLDTLRTGQCVTSGIKGHHTLYTRVGKKAAGRLLDGREWNEFPEAARG